MSNLYEINENGLKVPNMATILNNLQEKFRAIQGLENVDFSANTPDSNLINILALCQAEISEVLSYIYSQLNVATAIGINLDNLVALNGIVRNGGSYTELYINVVNNRTLTLQGASDNTEQATGFTISDNSGNQYILKETIELESGEHQLLFRSKYKGDIQPLLQTITNIDTPQLGLISVINNSAPVVDGEEMESDYELRNRFYKSFESKGTGTYESIMSKLYQLEGVKSVNGENNYASYTSYAGTPSHSIWLIVDGGDDDAIAETIYNNIDAGCGLRGEIEKEFIDEFNNPYYVRFDRPNYEQLYVKFKIQIKKDGYQYDENYIKQQLIDKLDFKINQIQDTTTITNILNSIDDNLVYYDLLISKDNANWEEMVVNSNINYCFILDINNITIEE